MEEAETLGNKGPKAVAEKTDSDFVHIGAFLHFAAWVNETLEDATQGACPGMSKKEGLVLLILYRRRGTVASGPEMERVFRDWNYAYYSDRASKDLGFGLAESLRSGTIEVEGLAPGRAPDSKPLTKAEIRNLGPIKLTQLGWERVNAMRSVIDRNLKLAQSSVAERFNRDLLKTIQMLDLPPEPEPV